MTEAVVVAAARTPIGRSHKGSLAGVDAFTLAEVVVSAVIERAGIDGKALDDLVLAESLQGGGAIARHTAVRLGLDSVPGLANNRHCAASLSAIAIAAGSIRSGMDRLMVAGGTESLSTTPRAFKAVPGSHGDMQPWYSPTHPATEDAPNRDMSITVGENTARVAGVKASRPTNGHCIRTFGPRPLVTQANSSTRSCPCQLSASTAAQRCSKRTSNLEPTPHWTNWRRFPYFIPSSPAPR